MKKTNWQLIENLIKISNNPLDGEPQLNQLKKSADGIETRHNYYRFFYHLIKHLKIDVSIEIGVEKGIGSAHMCAAAKHHNGIVIGIDINRHEIPLKTLNEIYGNYHFFNGKSQDVFHSVKNLLYGRKVGLIYQDSSHHYKESQSEFSMYKNLLDKNAIWICDDITQAFHDPTIDPPGKGMVEYFNELEGDKRLYTNVLHYGNTQGIILL